ncbi:hypothetical protein JAAARDRAFT_51746 [Jaapia argillacea MUCL 33604]|uniref:Uncharacterized protein n=1 Tax=Jaapia argillacea MUCL 33604 TaxID=933084 RepID=A0A067P422_9AGAM|nr:hypothetical protein JAAARDRAFT_51746 [Jaapia argillacea MUCL 33604]
MSSTKSTTRSGSSGVPADDAWRSTMDKSPGIDTTSIYVRWNRRKYPPQPLQYARHFEPKHPDEVLFEKTSFPLKSMPVEEPEPEAGPDSFEVLAQAYVDAREYWEIHPNQTKVVETALIKYKLVAPRPAPEPEPEPEPKLTPEPIQTVSVRRILPLPPPLRMKIPNITTLIPFRTRCRKGSTLSTTSTSSHSSPSSSYSSSTLPKSILKQPSRSPSPSRSVKGHRVSWALQLEEDLVEGFLIKQRKAEEKQRRKEERRKTLHDIIVNVKSRFGFDTTYDILDIGCPGYIYYDREPSPSPSHEYSEYSTSDCSDGLSETSSSDEYLPSDDEDLDLEIFYPAQCCYACRCVEAYL